MVTGQVASMTFGASTSPTHPHTPSPTLGTAITFVFTVTFWIALPLTSTTVSYKTLLGPPFRNWKEGGGHITPPPNQSIQCCVKRALPYIRSLRIYEKPPNIVSPSQRSLNVPNFGFKSQGFFVFSNFRNFRNFFFFNSEFPKLSLFFDRLAYPNLKKKTENKEK